MKLQPVYKHTVIGTQKFSNFSFKVEGINRSECRKKLNKLLNNPMFKRSL